jgi:ribonuclease HII
MTLSEMKRVLAEEDVPDDVMADILSDEREGAKKLVAAYKRRLERDMAERLRVEAMYEWETKLYQKGKGYIAGIDEVGRGPLAGPVTVAAVILKPHWFAAGLNDSKKVTPARREELAAKIREEAEAVSVFSLDAADIDTYNIYDATLLAMYEAVKRLPIRPEAVLVDAMPLHLPMEVHSLIHGDARSASIAAASIVAKVYRDHLMEEYEKQYPGYGFAQNKGYGTAAHIEAIARLGITPIHRRSFEPVKSMVH